MPKLILTCSPFCARSATEGIVTLTVSRVVILEALLSTVVSSEEILDEKFVDVVSRVVILEWLSFTESMISLKLAFTEAAMAGVPLVKVVSPVTASARRSRRQEPLLMSGSEGTRSFSSSVLLSVLLIDQSAV